MSTPINQGDVNVFVQSNNIQDDVSWNAHVESIVTKAGKCLYVVYQLKSYGVSQLT